MNLRRHRAPHLLSLLAVGALLLVGACSSDSTTGSGTTAPGTSAAPGTTNPADNAPTDPFYVAPDPLPAGKPGDVIRSEPLPGAPAGSQAWKVLYLSIDFNGVPTAVSGVVIAPTGSTTAGTTPGSQPASDRPVLSWAHPTTGVVDDCAPSTTTEFFALIPGLETFLAAGYVVAATDYVGLGTAGVHPYLVGESEGAAVLDAARAARNLPDTGAGRRLLLWGHSQGGQGALFAGQMAVPYAPELELVATAAAAPAGELQELLDDDSGDATGVVLGSYAVNAYQDLYGPENPGMEATQVVTTAGETGMDAIVKLCNLNQTTEIAPIAAPLVGKFFVDDPGSVEPWKTLLEKNTAGRTPIDSPVLLTQGDADTTVIPATTSQLQEAYCDGGTNAALKTYPGVTHDLIGYESAPDVAAWMAAVLAGQAPPFGCPPPSGPGTTAGT